MNKFRNLLIISLVTVAFLMVGTAAMADSATLVLDSTFQSGIGPLSFSGTITNGSTAVFLNGDNIQWSGPSLPWVDDPGFITNTNPTLAPSESTGDVLLFTLSVPNGTPLGLYEGTYQILGGASASDQGVLASELFSVEVTSDVQPVPEPSSYMLFGTGLLALGFLARRKLLA